jgi:hypothetical protein
MEGNGEMDELSREEEHPYPEGAGREEHETHRQEHEAYRESPEPYGAETSKHAPAEQPSSYHTQGAATSAADEQQSTAHMDSHEMNAYRQRWQEIRASFVDEPRQAVQQADRLVEDVIQHFTRFFTEERTKLEQQWSRDDELSTEDLRVALQRYRTFLHGLLR